MDIKEKQRLKRLAGETEEAYLWRIGQMVDTAILPSWSEINDVVNGELGIDEDKWRDESAFRKKYQAAKKFYDNVFSKSQGTASGENLDEKIDTIKKLTVSLRDERNELNRKYREASRRDAYIDQLVRAVKEADLGVLDYDDNKNFKGVLESDNDMIISFSDVHAGINIDNFWNKFDSYELKNRLNQYLDKIFEVYVRHGSENIYVILSELVSGIIHPTLRIENNQNLIEQFLTVVNYCAEFLAELSYRVNTVHVYIAPGNHSRISPKKEESLSGENMDILAIPFLAAKLQNFDNIKFHENTIEQSIAMFSVRGKKIFSAHGDKDTPDTVVQKFTMLFGMKPDIVYLFHRHFNSMTTVYDTRIVQSGCMSGPDSYSMDHRIRNKPEQTISIVNEDGLECLYNVTLE